MIADNRIADAPAAPGGDRIADEPAPGGDPFADAPAAAPGGDRIADEPAAAPDGDPFDTVASFMTVVWRTSDGGVTGDAPPDVLARPDVRQALRRIDADTTHRCDHPAAPLMPSFVAPLITDRPIPLADLVAARDRRNATLTAVDDLLSSAGDPHAPFAVVDALPDIFDVLRMLRAFGVERIRQTASGAIQWAGDPPPERAGLCAAGMKRLNLLWRQSLALGEALSFRSVAARITPAVLLATMHDLGVRSVTPQRSASLHASAAPAVVAHGSGGDDRLLAAVLVRTLAPLLAIATPHDGAAACAPADLLPLTAIDAVIAMLAAHGVRALRRSAQRFAWIADHDHPDLARVVRLATPVLLHWIGDGEQWDLDPAHPTWPRAAPAAASAATTQAVIDALNRLVDYGVERIERPTPQRLRLRPDHVPASAIDVIAPWSAIIACRIAPMEEATLESLRAALLQR